MQKLYTWSSAHTQKLLLLDACGAFISAFMLGYVWVEFQNLVGLPEIALYILAAIPMAFVAYDFLNYQQKDAVAFKALAVMARLNVFYCLVSLSILGYYFASLTPLAYAYFLGEIILVLFLARLEFRTARLGKGESPTQP